MSDHADILNIIGLDKSAFNAAGEDVRVEMDDKDSEVRVFRRGGRVVYRAGDAIKWYSDEEELPDNRN